MMAVNEQKAFLLFLCEFQACRSFAHFPYPLTDRQPFNLSSKSSIQAGAAAILPFPGHQR
jgi:hypothetical protein